MRTLIWHQQAHNHWYLYLFSSSTPSRNTTTEYLRCKANPSVLQSPSSHGFSGTSSSEQLPSCCCLVAKSCPTLCDPTDCSTQGSSVLHYLPEFVQTHIHRVSDAIFPSHPLQSSSPFAFNLSQHQGLFQWVSPSHQVAKVLEHQREYALTGAPQCGPCQCHLH